MKFEKGDRVTWKEYKTTRRAVFGTVTELKNVGYYVNWDTEQRFFYTFNDTRVESALNGLQLAIRKAKES